MNQNTEYERFTQEIYQQLVDSDVVKATTVQHNVKLIGRSGQKHQIDVYWEYEIAGNMHKVAIECKNYNKSVPLSVVQGFKGVLDDLNGVNGIIVTKKGFQIGAKQYAKEWGISLKELRTPDRGETIIGEIEFNTYCEIRHTLYKLDEEWALQHGMDFSRYKRTLDLMSFSNDGSPDKSGGKFFNSIENLHLCTMNNQGLLALAQLILPSEILSNFEVVRVEEEASLIRIYLDESVKAEYKENPEIESKGFCEAVTIRDFPIRDKGVDLIVRRRKWYDKQNNRYFSDSYDLKAEETRYSKEFAAFLKGVYGDDSYDLPFA